MRWLVPVAAFLLAGCLGEAPEPANVVSQEAGPTQDSSVPPTSNSTNEQQEQDPSCTSRSPQRTERVVHEWPFPDDGNTSYQFSVQPGDFNLTVSVTTNVSGMGILTANLGDTWFYINATAPNGTIFSLQRNDKTIYMPDPEAGMTETPAQWFTRYLAVQGNPGEWLLGFEGRGTVRTTAILQFAAIDVDC